MSSLLNQTVIYFKNQTEVISKVVDLNQDLVILENNDQVNKDLLFPFPSDFSTDSLFIKNLPKNYNFRKPNQTLQFLHPRGVFNLTINFQRIFSTLHSFSYNQKQLILTKFHKFAYELIDSLELVEVNQNGEEIFKSTLFKCFVVASVKTNTLITVRSQTPTYYKLHKKHESPLSKVDDLKKSASDPVMQNKVIFIIKNLESFGYTHTQTRSDKIRTVMMRSNLRIMIDISASQDLRLHFDYKNDSGKSMAYRKIRYSEITDLNATIQKFESLCENSKNLKFNKAEVKLNYKQDLFPEVVKSLVNHGLHLSRIILENGQAELSLVHKGFCGRIELTTGKNGVISSLTTHKLSADRITSLDQIENLVHTYRQVISQETSTNAVLEAKLKSHPYLKVINQVKSLGYELSDVSPSGAVALTKNKYQVKIQTGQTKVKLGFDVESQDKMGQVPLNNLKNITYFIEQCEFRNKNQRYCPKLVLRDLNLQGWGE